MNRDLRKFIGPSTQTPLNMMPMEQVRPTNQAPIVRLVDGAPLVGNARWSLTPWFHKKQLKEWKATTFNARAETVNSAASFRQCFAQRRCLVVADGWYEWTGPKGSKQPWLFTPKADQPPMTFAGLWDRCDTPDEGAVESFTIVTQPAGSPLNGYHDRAPVTLFGDEWARWLDCSSDAPQFRSFVIPSWQPRKLPISTRLPVGRHVTRLSALTQKLGAERWTF